MTRTQAIANLKTKIDAMNAAPRALEVVAAPKLQPREFFLQIGGKPSSIAARARRYVCSSANAAKAFGTIKAGHCLNRSRPNFPQGMLSPWNSAAAHYVFELTEFRSDARISAWARLNDQHARNAGHR
jgi:hypothetical protein